MKVKINEDEYYPYYQFSKYTGIEVDIDDDELKDMKDLFSKFHAMQKRLGDLASEGWRKENE